MPLCYTERECGRTYALRIISERELTNLYTIMLYRERESRRTYVLRFITEREFRVEGLGFRVNIV